MSKKRRTTTNGLGGTVAKTSGLETDFSPIVDESILEPWRYIHNVPGKNVRGMMMDAFQLWLKVPDPPLNTIKDIVATLHDASLL